MMSFELEASVAIDGHSLVDLPSELLLDIGQYLSIAHLACLAATCRRLQGVVSPAVYQRDRITGAYRTLSWAAYTRKAQAVATIERALSYWRSGIDDLQCYFKSNQSPHGRSLECLTPLLAAIQAGNHRVVCFLLAQGVNPDLPEASPGCHDTLWFPIHYAMMIGYSKTRVQSYSHPNKLRIIETLLVSGANPNQMSLPNPARRNQHRHLGIVTPLHLAIKSRADHRAIELLIAAGAVATRSPYYQIPDQPFSDISPIAHLIYRCNEASNGHCVAVRTLAINGGGIGSEAQEYTVTRQALLIDHLSRPRASRHYVAITKALMEHTWVRIDDTAENGDGVIVHHLRSHIGWRPVKQYPRRLILRHEEENDMARIAITTCDTIDFLLSQSANINEKGALGETPLHVAIGLHRNYSRVIISHLLTRGAMVGARTSRGYTILHSLVLSDPEADYTLITDVIKYHRLNRYARDKEGNTFLHHLVSRPVAAFDRWMAEVVKYYRRSDFYSPRSRNKAGQTPWEAAEVTRDYDNGEAAKGPSARQFWITTVYDEAKERSEQARKLQTVLFRCKE